MSRFVLFLLCGSVCVWALAAHSAFQNRALARAVISLQHSNNALIALAKSRSIQNAKRREKLKKMQKILKNLIKEEQILRKRLAEYLRLLKEADNLKSDMERLRRLVEDRKR